MQTSKADLIQALADETGASKADAAKSVDFIFAKIHGDLKSGKKVALSGVGTFSVAERAAREGRNPATGATVQIAAKKVVKFKPASAFTV